MFEFKWLHKLLSKSYKYIPAKPADGQADQKLPDIDTNKLVSYNHQHIPVPVYYTIDSKIVKQEDDMRIPLVSSSCSGSTATKMAIDNFKTMNDIINQDDMYEGCSLTTGRIELEVELNTDDEDEFVEHTTTPEQYLPTPRTFKKFDKSTTDLVVMNGYGVVLLIDDEYVEAFIDIGKDAYLSPDQEVEVYQHSKNKYHERIGIVINYSHNQRTHNNDDILLLQKV